MKDSQEAGPEPQLPPYRRTRVRWRRKPKIQYLHKHLGQPRHPRGRCQRRAVCALCYLLACQHGARGTIHGGKWGQRGGGGGCSRLRIRGPDFQVGFSNEFAV